MLMRHVINLRLQFFEFTNMAVSVGYVVGWRSATLSSLSQGMTYRKWPQGSRHALTDIKRLFVWNACKKKGTANQKQWTKDTKVCDSVCLMIQSIEMHEV